MRIAALPGRLPLPRAVLGLGPWTRKSGAFLPRKSAGPGPRSLNYELSLPEPAGSEMPHASRR